MFKKPLRFLSQIILLFSILIINTSYADLIKELRSCIKQNNDAFCADSFLQKRGIDVENDLLDFNDLQLTEGKTVGASKGGIYVHKEDPSQIYFVKQTKSQYKEFMVSRFMNLIVGTQASPIIKVIKNKSFTTASLKLQNFSMFEKSDITNKIVLGEVLLIVAMDWLGSIDRHARNIGYVQISDNVYLAARVDFDASFDYESVSTGTHQFQNTNHLDLKHLFITLQNYPQDEVDQAIRKIVEISDEQIISIAVQTWKVLSHTKSPKKLEKCLAAAKKLIERKRAFKKVLNNKMFDNPSELFR